MATNRSLMLIAFVTSTAAASAGYSEPTAGQPLGDACKATVTYSGADEYPTGSGRTRLTFHVAVDVSNSVGRFAYRYTYTAPDGTQTQLEKDIGNWSAGDGAAFDLFDSIPVDPSKITNVAVEQDTLTCTNVGDGDTRLNERARP